MKSQSHPLAMVSEEVRRLAPSSRVAVIFDLDSTLFCVSPRTRAILRRLGSEPEFQRKYPAEAEVMRTIDVHPTDWGVRAVLERENILPSLEFFLEIRGYWKHHFFSSEFLEHDEIYPSANEYVSHLHSLGAEILYLTGRSEGKMREGTRRALSANGFPFFDETRLIMKPSDVLADESFKAGILKELLNRYEHIWFFENEPLIIEQVRSRHPQVKLVFMNSVHAGRAQPPSDLPTIGMNYGDGLKAILAKKST